MTVTFGKICLRICVNAPVIVGNCTIWGWEKSKSYKNESMDFAPQLINCGTEGIFKFPEREKEALLQFAPQSASPIQSYQGIARTGLKNKKSPEGTETLCNPLNTIPYTLENKKPPEGTETFHRPNHQ